MNPERIKQDAKRGVDTEKDGLSNLYNSPGGFKYLVKDGKTGILVPLDDENTFVEQICRLIEHPEERKAMGQAALKEVENYRIENIVRQWMDLFTELLKKKHEKHK